jgi:hypothetical protein
MLLFHILKRKTIEFQDFTLTAVRASEVLNSRHIGIVNGRKLQS